MLSSSLCIVLALIVTIGISKDVGMKALVYRGPVVCDGCPEAVAELLQQSPWKFSIAFAGPDEEVDVTTQSLREVQVFAFPGGPGRSLHTDL